MTCVVPSRYGVSNSYRTLPFGVSERRCSATAAPRGINFPSKIDSFEAIHPFKTSPAILVLGQGNLDNEVVHALADQRFIIISGY
jgi:hypothetical protein